MPDHWDYDNDDLPDPDDPSPQGRRAAPGTYSFVVDDCEDKTWSTGNKGVAIQLKVAAFEDKDITVYDRLTFTKKALWKVQQLLISLGMDPADQPTNDEVVGKQGVCKFDLGKERDGKRYLEPVEYMEPGTEATGAWETNESPGNKPAMGGGGKGGSGKKSEEHSPFDELSEDEVPF